MPLKLNAIALSMLFLSACGGGSSPKGSNTPSNSNNHTAADWEVVSFKNSLGDGTGGFEQVVRQGNSLYFATTVALNHSGRYLFKSDDLVNAKVSHIDKHPGFLLFVDETGYVRFEDYYSEDGVTFIKKRNIDIARSPWANPPSVPIYRFSTFSGNQDAILWNLGNDNYYSYISYDRGDTFDFTLNQGGIKHDPDKIHNTRSIKSTESAFDGHKTFYLAGDDKGLLVSRDLGKSWITILPEVGGFEAVATNKHHSNTVFAGKRGALYRSLDGGLNWQTVNQPTYEGSNVLLWADIELLDDGTLIALVAAESLGYGRALFFESIDLGKSWVMVGEPVRTGAHLTHNFGNIEGTDDFYLMQAQSSAFYARKRK